MVASPVPTSPSKWQASLGLKIATKQMTDFGLYLPWDFLPFLCKTLDSPKYLHRYPFLSRNFILKPAHANSECFPFRLLSDFYFSLSFFSWVWTWMSSAIAQGKEDFVRGLLPSREEFLTDGKPSLPMTQQAVAKDTIPHKQSSGWYVHREQALRISPSQPQLANVLTTAVTNRVRSFPFPACWVRINMPSSHKTKPYKWDIPVLCNPAQD